MKKQKEMTDIIKPIKERISHIIMDELVLKTITPSSKEDQDELIDMVEEAVEEFLTELHDHLVDEEEERLDAGIWEGADKVMHEGKWYVSYNHTGHRLKK